MSCSEFVGEILGAASNRRTCGEGSTIIWFLIRVFLLVRGAGSSDLDRVLGVLHKKGIMGGEAIRRGIGSGLGLSVNTCGGLSLLGVNCLLPLFLKCQEASLLFQLKGRYILSGCHRTIPSGVGGVSGLTPHVQYSWKQ